MNINSISLKYGFSIYSKEDLISIMNSLQHTNKEDYFVVKNYYFQRFPIVFCKFYLGLDLNSKVNENELIVSAAIIHQKDLLQNYTFYKRIIHFIDGLSYECNIKYGSGECNCGIKGYEWNTPNDIIYRKSYWLKDSYIPLISIKKEPILTMVDELDIINRYINDSYIELHNSQVKFYWINSKNINNRIKLYPFYYSQYWNWEHLKMK